MNPFLENTPFLRLFIALSVGVGLRALIGVSLSLLIPLFIIGSILFGLTLFQKRLALQGQRGWFGLMLMLWLVGLGWQINNAYYASHIPFQYQSDGVYEVVVDRFPIERPKSVMVYATVQGRVVDHTLKNMHGRVILYLEKDSAAMSLTPGRELLYLGGFSLPQGQHPNGFDYGKYLYENGIMGSGYADVEHWKPVGVSSQFHVKWMAERWRYELLKRLRSIPLQPDVLQLVSAVTLGYRDEMPKPLKSIYRDSGASHVLAVSGLHVGILFMMLLLLFRFLDRWVAGVVIKPILIILLLWGYALITGLSPSVCRAAFMFSIMTVALSLRRDYLTYNALFCSAFFLLLLNPMLLFSVSFLLSYSAVLSILYFYPLLLKLWHPKQMLLRRVWELCVVSLAAQIGTFSFVLYFFHQFPIYGMLSNLVVIPVVTLIFYIVLLFFVLGYIGVIGIAIAYVLNLLVKINNAILSMIAELPRATWSVWIEGWQFVVLLALCGAIFWVVYRKNGSSMLLMLALLLLFIGSFPVMRYYNLHKEVTVLVYDDVVRVYGPNVHVIYTLDSLYTDEDGDIFAMRYHLPKAQVMHATEKDYLPFCFNGVKYLMIDKESFRYKLCDVPMAVDVLIVGGGVYPSERLFNCFVNPSQVIFLNSVNNWNVNRYSELIDNKRIKIHTIRNQGAWKTEYLKEEDFPNNNPEDD